MNNTTKMAVPALAFTALGISVLAGLIYPSASRANDDDGITPSVSQADRDEGYITFTVDVAEQDTTNKQNDVDPLEGQDTFSRGDTFVLDGNVYRGGKLPRGAADNDPNAPGIGRYRSRGTNTDGPTASLIGFTSESFSLPDDRNTILTDGLWPNEGFSAQRVVLGGTGRFRGMVGEAYEENIGRNKTQFCNLRVTFKIRKAAFRHER